MYIVDQLNAARVWPTGFHAMIKRIRFVLRVQVNSAIFETLATSAVILNTVILMMQKYGMEEEEKKFLEDANSILTDVFAYEMGVKLLAIGVRKYL